MPEKTVLIIGGGVAALAAAAALVESNQQDNPVRFKVHILTQAHRWGGRASSWSGGAHGPHLDLTMWPPDVTLNHGFHAIFDESTYTNFWPTFSKPWNDPPSDPYQTLRSRLCSNRHEFLVYEKSLVRLTNEEGLGSTLRNTWELVWKGGWSLRELWTYKQVVRDKVRSYRSFADLQQVDPLYSNDDFDQWCRTNGLPPSVQEKQLYKFLAHGTYVAPHKLDTASAIRGLWVFDRDYEASEWFYIDGSITRDIMEPLTAHLRANGVTWSMLTALQSLTPKKGAPVIDGYQWAQESGHPPSGGAGALPPVHSEHGAAHSHSPQDSFVDHCRCAAPPASADYYLCTLPLPDCWGILQASGIGGAFPNIETLAGGPFPAPVATVNLQAWFQDKVLSEDIKNVIAGLEPLCVMIDYKHLLRHYEDDEAWPGSVIEVNGAALELQARYKTDYGKLKAPSDPGTIEFAKTILLDLADRYEFYRLRDAVRNEAFLQRPDWPDRTRWKPNGTEVPPFLWINSHDHNGFFVTTPGTWALRPTVTTDYANLFLAGDWTKNGFDVPCMESAARSGRMAAREIQKAERCPTLIRVYDPH